MTCSQVSEADATLCAMKFRLYPSDTQKVLLLEQCAHARYVWNLGLEQRLMWRRWKGPTPGLGAQVAQLTAARASEPWLAGGSQTVQQQALRDLDQGWRHFFAGSVRTTVHAAVCWCRRSAGCSSNAAAPSLAGSRTASPATGRAVGISRWL